jgi:transposase-like protein
MIDWVWISKNICLIIYYKYIQKKVIRFGFYEWERYEDIRSDLQILRDEFQYDITSFTVDGGKQIKKAIEEIYPESKIQRCLTHIHRQIQNYISKNPQSDCGKDLQKIITFENFENMEKFQREFKIGKKNILFFWKRKVQKEKDHGINIEDWDKQELI